MQAYIDDSYDDKNGVYVLAGCFASSESWDDFNKEWEKLLPDWGTVNKKNDAYHFKMNDMHHDGRKERLPVFMSTIEKFIHGFVYAKINIYELKRAQNRIQVDGLFIDWKEYDAFFFTFRALLDKFHLERHRMVEVLGEEKIDFIFDEQVQKNRVYAMWDNYINNRSPEIRKYYGEMPRFEDDEKTIPLQCADLMAGWIKNMYVEGTPEKILELDFQGFAPLKNRKLLRVEIIFNEQDIVKSLMKIVRTQLGPERVIVDLGPKLNTPLSLKI
jgi:hypothetical protein